MSSIDYLINRIGSDDTSFLAVYRPAADPSIEFSFGTSRSVGGIEQLAKLCADVKGVAGGPELIAAIPYRQVEERGFEAAEDDTPLLAIVVDEALRIERQQFLTELVDLPRPRMVEDLQYDLDDEAYADLVRRVIHDEVNYGEGANFVMSRSCLGRFDSYGALQALSIFQSLLADEVGSYWTFWFWTPDHCLIGASPECHVLILDGTMSMNPISGTFRYGPIGTNKTELHRFLDDQKETEELYMVVDEELKMLAKVCDRNVRVEGPSLRYMQRLIHTEYFLRGRVATDRVAALRETLMAPTVTGSPQESACRVIARYEATPRAYYSGVLARFGRDSGGRPDLDSTILIRTAHLKPGGEVAVRVGASIVRSSDPSAEALETKAKAEALLGILAGASRGGAAIDVAGLMQQVEHDHVIADKLAARNARLASFWFAPGQDKIKSVLPADVVNGADRDWVGSGSVCIVDAEDRFTYILAYQIQALGLAVKVVPYSAVWDAPVEDLLVVGPGPGDPTDITDPKIATLHHLTRLALETGKPFLSVCLGHQVLAATLGLAIERRPFPNQGTQREVNLFGRQLRLGYYNSFAATSRASVLETSWGVVEVARNPEMNGGSRDRAPGVGVLEVEALSGPFFRSFQFHPESVLSEHGNLILAQQLKALLDLHPTPARV